MNAGRELDALIAEKVMGLKREVRLHGTTETVEIYTDNPYFNNVVQQRELHHVQPLPFSTDIAAAWAVVEKLTASGFHFLLLKSADSKLSIASFYLGPQDRSDESATDSSTALAICLAALQAVGYDHEGE